MRIAPVPGNGEHPWTDQELSRRIATYIRLQHSTSGPVLDPLETLGSTRNDTRTTLQVCKYMMKTTKKIRKKRRRRKKRKKQQQQQKPLYLSLFTCPSLLNKTAHSLKGSPASSHGDTRAI